MVNRGNRVVSGLRSALPLSLEFGEKVTAGLSNEGVDLTLAQGLCLLAEGHGVSPDRL